MFICLWCQSYIHSLSKVKVNTFPSSKIRKKDENTWNCTWGIKIKYVYSITDNLDASFALLPGTDEIGKN